MLALAACVEAPRVPAALPGAARFEDFSSPAVPFVAYARLDPSPVLTVYIEGDGAAWHRGRPPTDPTPRHPIALELAASDPTASLLYLGRPCQFAASADSACDPAWWQQRRFAPEVIGALDDAISAAERRMLTRYLVLVGYSGGAAAASLLALRHPETVLLVTVAGVIDTRAWTRRLDLAPLDGSLNPAENRAGLARIRQIHLVGTRDEIVPPDLTEAFVAGLGPGAPARIERRDLPHDGDWREGWSARIVGWREEALPGG